MTLSQDQLNTILLAIGGSWVTLLISVAVIKTEIKQVQKDIDGIAEFIGTPRALARKKK